MSTPGSWARLEFPTRFLDDEINKELAEYYGDSENGEPDIEDGIFCLEDGEAAYGEFEELETLLKKKGIPYDRETAMDWNQPPCRQIYRPARNGNAEMDERIQLNSDGEVAVSVRALREVLTADDGFSSGIEAYLDEHFPTYLPLTDWVKED